MWPRLKRRRCLLEYSIRVGQNFQRLLSVKLIYSRERSKNTEIACAGIKDFGREKMREATGAFPRRIGKKQRP
jgi:hypothetical protein